ncbi:hypothetical protein [Streptosporangium roseum]|uniref:hypothetical protein n=1 Tax=Streptosporangium roseum TaxID=2001 RepID=UPI00333445C3
MIDRFAWSAGELIPEEELDDMEDVSEAFAEDDDLDDVSTRALSERVSLAEAAGGMTPKGRRFRARLIAGDIQGSSGYYSAAMLKKHAGVFHEGLPVFLDHPSATDAYERPERSVRDLAGRLASPAVYERDGLYADVEVYPHWAPVVEAMADHIGMSIRASGTVEASTNESIRGPIVTSLTEAASVDFVTAAGAGGKLVSLLESARAHSGDLLRKAIQAVDLVETMRGDTPPISQQDVEPAFAEVVETSAPNVPAPPATTLEESRMSGTNPQGAPEGGASTETEVTEAVTASARAAVAEAERDQYRASAQALTEAQQAQARAIAERDAAISESRRLVANDSARNAVSRLIAESGLPGAVAALVGPRVTSAVLDRVPLTESGHPNTQALDAAVKAAIEAERTYAAALMEAHGVGDVRGLGGSTDTETLSESDFNAALESVFTGVGMGADVAKAAAKGRMNF